MLGDDLQSQQPTQPIYEQSASPTPPAQSPPVTPISAPPTTYTPLKPKFPLIPALIGVFVVIIASSLLGVVYFKTVFKPTASLSPVPTSPSPTPSLTPSPSSTSSASPKASLKATAKPTIKPVSVLPSTNPTPTPVPIPSLDIRFGNPSTNIKQTYDDGSGAGRVINREYTSIQSGQFDELPASWGTKVTLCYHIVANEEVKGKDVKLKLTLDDNATVEDTLGQYDKLEPGRLYDWCRDTSIDMGKHTAKLIINGDNSLKELYPSNNTARLEWENVQDKIAPNFTLIGPKNEGTAGTCLFPQYISDNVTLVSNLKIEQQVDSESWTAFPGTRYCFTGTAGSSHSYKIKITDSRGNVSEQSKSFVLY